MKRLLSFLFLAVSTLSAKSLPDESKDRAEILLREIFAFSPGGIVEINDSFGDVRVEGWDQNDIEITTIRASRKEYAARDQAKAIAELNRIVITPAKVSDSKFVISTEFPSRSLFSRPLRGKSNLEMEYRIRVPRESNLVIRHDIGEVKVAGVTGNLEITSRIGEVAVRLPDGDVYRIDAHSKIGEVNSEIDGWSQRRMLLGEKFEAEAPAYVKRIFVRVGVGAIQIRKMHSQKVIGTVSPVSVTL